MNAFVNEGCTYGEGVMAAHLICWSMVVSSWYAILFSGECRGRHD